MLRFYSAPKRKLDAQNRNLHPKEFKLPVPEEPPKLKPSDRKPLEANPLTLPEVVTRSCIALPDLKKIMINE